MKKKMICLFGEGGKWWWRIATRFRWFHCFCF